MTSEDLKAWRRSECLTQAAAAALFGVSRRTYCYWESGQQRMPGPASVLLRLYHKHGATIPEV